MRLSFYSAKIVCFELGICRESLETRIKKGIYPPYEKSPTRSNGVGYFENTFEAIRVIKLPKRGRPKKLVS